MFGEHTWGYNMMRLPVRYGKAWEAERAKGTYAKLERSFAEKGQYIRGAEAAVEPALHQSERQTAARDAGITHHAGKFAWREHRQISSDGTRRT
jgi:hypothetical protein